MKMYEISFKAEPRQDRWLAGSVIVMARTKADARKHAVAAIRDSEKIGNSQITFKLNNPNAFKTLITWDCD